MFLATAIVTILLLLLLLWGVFMEIHVDFSDDDIPEKFKSYDDKEA